MRQPKVLIALITVAVLVAAAVTYQRAIAGPSPVVSDAPLLGAPTTAARLDPTTAVQVIERQGAGVLFTSAAQVTVKYGAWKPDFVRAGLSGTPINVWVVTLTGLYKGADGADLLPLHGGTFRGPPRAPHHTIAFILDDTSGKMLEATTW